MGIQGFSALAYIKDLATGKLDLWACIGQFVGYDSESKGYCIYQPHKHSVIVEQDIIFNKGDILVKNDHVIIPSNILAEGERDKVIQHPVNIPKPEDEQPELQHEINEPKNSELPSNSILFPLAKALPFEPPQQQAPHGPEMDPLAEPNVGCNFRVCHAPGYYARLNKGLDANFARVEESNGEAENICEEALFAVDGDLYVPLPADYALTVSLRNGPKMVDGVLHSPHAKQWQAAYEYEIAQLKKLSNWELVKLPPGKTPILHSLVFKEKTWHRWKHWLLACLTHRWSQANVWCQLWWNICHSNENTIYLSGPS